MPSRASHDPAVQALLADLDQEALRAQHELLKEFRTGAGMLLAATSLIASFLGSQALARGGLTTVAWIAIGALACSLLAAVVVVLPNLSLAFVVPTTQLRTAASHRASITVIHGEIRHQARRALDANAASIRRLYSMYVVAAACVCGQVALWIWQLAATM